MHWSGRFSDRTRKSTNKGVDCRGSSEVNAFMRSKRNSEIEQENTTFRVLSAMSCASLGWIAEREYYLKGNNNAITTTSRPLCLWFCKAICRRDFRKELSGLKICKVQPNKMTMQQKTWSVSIAAQFLFSKNTLEFSPFDIHKCMMIWSLTIIVRIFVYPAPPQYQ